MKLTHTTTTNTLLLLLKSVLTTNYTIIRLTTTTTTNNATLYTHLEHVKYSSLIHIYYWASVCRDTFPTANRQMLRQFHLDATPRSQVRTRKARVIIFDAIQY